MTATEQQVRMAAQLYQARDAARSLLGDKYHARMHMLGEVLKSIAVVDGGNELQAAIAAAKKLNGTDALFVLAAAVELAEPTPKGH